MNKRMAEKKRMKALQKSSQRPDLNLTDMLRWKLKRAVHKLNEPKQHWKEEQANIPPQQWELMTSYRNTSGYCC